MLTVLGYSLNDTIVIFDRVRENLKARGNRSLAMILNLSINETLPRTILTGGTTLATALDTVEGATFLLFCHDDVVLEADAVRVMVEEA